MKPCLQAVSGQPLRPYRASLLTILILTVLPMTAQRDPVLKQINLPHRYYYREMYLPQLTTGPNSAAWTSDSSSLVYSISKWTRQPTPHLLTENRLMRLSNYPLTWRWEK